MKIPGGGIHDSSVVRGMVLKRDAEGTVKRVTDGKSPSSRRASTPPAPRPRRVPPANRV